MTERPAPSLPPSRRLRLLPRAGFRFPLPRLGHPPILLGAHLLLPLLVLLLTLLIPGPGLRSPLPGERLPLLLLPQARLILALLLRLPLGLRLARVLLLALLLGLPLCLRLAGVLLLLQPVPLLLLPLLNLLLALPL